MENLVRWPLKASYIVYRIGEFEQIDFRKKKEELVSMNFPESIFEKIR